MASSSIEIVLTSSPDSPIMASDTSSGATLAHFTGSRTPRKDLALVGKARIAASHISLDIASSSVHLYNWWSSTAIHHLPIPEPVAPLIATLDGLYLFCGGLSGHLHVLSLPSGNLLRLFSAHSKPVSCLTINDDESLLVSGGDDGMIAVFPVLQHLDASSNDNSNQSPLYRFVEHTSSVMAITSGSGSIIVSSSLDCTCKYWSLSYGTHIRTVRFPCMIWGVVMEPTESEFYFGGSDGWVYVGVLKVDRRQLVTSGNEWVTWAPEHGAAMTAMAMVNDGQNLVSASEDGSARVWEVQRGQVIRIVGYERGSISDLVVAKGIRNGGGHNVRFTNKGTESSGSSLGFSGREICKSVREVTEQEEMLSVVVKDRRNNWNIWEALGTHSQRS